MPYFAVIGTAFALAFLAELPDKSMFASLVLGTRYRPSWVWAGAAAAFAVHMAIAVTAGRLLTLLPHHVTGVPMAWIRRITAAIMLGLGVYTALAALTG